MSVFESLSNMKKYSAISMSAAFLKVFFSHPVMAVRARVPGLSASTALFAFHNMNGNSAVQRSLFRGLSSNGLRSTTTEDDAVAVHQKMVVQNMLYRIRKCNHIPETLKLIDFVVDGKLVGKVRENLVDRLLSVPSSCFVLEEDGSTQRLSLSKSLVTTEERSDAVMKVMEVLRKDGIIKGWRDELLPVVTSFYDEEPVFLIERAAAPHMGTIQYGVHINGYVTNSDGSSNHWMARRSKTKSKYPGMLDHIVAGGQPFGITPSENVVKVSSN